MNVSNQSVCVTWQGLSCGVSSQCGVTWQGLSCGVSSQCV